MTPKHEIDSLGPLPGEELGGPNLRPRQRMSRLEQQMRVYGGDLIAAFKLLETAIERLDMGAAAEASSLARAAGAALRDPMRTNDKDRNPLDIVGEVAAIYKWEPEFTPFGLQADPRVIKEIMIRLEVSQSKAIELIVKWYDQRDRGAQLESGETRGLPSGS